MEELINVVDSNGKRIRTIEKLEAHIRGELHEAFSIFVFNAKNELLLQRRALAKYHSGGLWTNTCCSHPRVGEEPEPAAHRRLTEEMGFDCGLKKAFSLVYKTNKTANGLIEHEYDNVFFGEIDDALIVPDPEEVCEYKWLNIARIKEDLNVHPENYTQWFKTILDNDKFMHYFQNINKNL